MNFTGMATAVGPVSPVGMISGWRKPGLESLQAFE
jgi:hypothetical protein